MTSIARRVLAPISTLVVSFRAWILRCRQIALAGAHGELRNADAAYRHRADGCGGAPPPPPNYAAPSRAAPGDKTPRASRRPRMIVGVIVAAIAGTFDLVSCARSRCWSRGEVDATRLDIAARIDGRVADIPVTRGETSRQARCWCGSTIPEKTSPSASTQAAAKVVADAQLANINAGTRPEVIAARKARTGAGAGERGPSAEDLRPYQPVGRARQCAAGTARPGDGYLA